MDMDETEDTLETQDVEDDYEPDLENRYWAAYPKDQLGDQISAQVSMYYRGISDAGLLELWQLAVSTYYSLSSDGTTHEASRIFEFGEHGEKLGVVANHFRSLVKYMHASTTADRPAVTPKAINGTAKALAQVPIARRVDEYYNRVMKVERQLIAAALRALLYGKSYILQMWDTGVLDLTTKAYAPTEIACDLDKDPYEHDWFIIRRKKNRYDLAATWAGNDEELYNEIIEMDTDPVDDDIIHILDTGFTKNLRKRGDDACDDILYEYILLHRRTPSLPDGRIAFMIGDGKCVFEGPLPYDVLPVSEMVPEEFLEVGGLGYASAWDLMGLQQAYTGLLSTAMTNFDAYGHNDLLIPEGVEIGVEEIRDGLTALRYPMGEHNKPTILEKFAMRSEHFELMKLVRSDLEVTSGVNSVARGEPQSSLKSGSALALVQAQAVHLQNGMIASYAYLMEDVASIRLGILKRYSSPEQIKAIAGDGDTDGLVAYGEPDLGLISRMEVERVDPVMHTIPGRMQVADQLLERNLIRSPDEYFQVLSTGRLEPVTDPDRQQNVFAQAVKEYLLTGPGVEPVMITGPMGAPEPKLDEFGQPVMQVVGMPVLITDNPAVLLRAAKTVLDSVENRKNQAVVQACTTFIMSLMNTWKIAPADMLNILGHPLPMMAGMGAQEEMPSSGGGGQVGPEQDKQAPPEGSNMPSLPNKEG